MAFKKLTGGAFGARLMEGDGTHYERRCRFVYTGLFQSMDGPVTVTPDDLSRLAAKHNARMTKARNEVGDWRPEMCPPVQLDHSSSATHTVGRVVGEVTLGHEVIDGVDRLALYGTVRIKGSDNIEKAEDGRFATLSIGADFEGGVINEISITPFPAAARASLLKQGSTHMTLEQLRSKLMARDALSTEQADEKLAGMTDEEKEQLSKFGEAEPAKEEEPAKEDDKKEDAKPEPKGGDEAPPDEVKAAKMTALRTKLTTLSAASAVTLASARLSVKKSRIAARLSKLQAETKITPAEIKKIKIDELAAKSDEAIDAALESYQNRQPVLLTGQMGAVDGIDLKDVAKVERQARLSALEAQARADFARGGKKPKGAKLTAEAAEREVADATAASTVTAPIVKSARLGAGDMIDGLLSAIEEAASTGNVTATMAACKALRNALHDAAEGYATAVTPDGEMVGLSARVEELGAQLGEFQTAITELLGA